MKTDLNIKKIREITEAKQLKNRKKSAAEQILKSSEELKIAMQRGQMLVKSVEFQIEKAARQGNSGFKFPLVRDDLGLVSMITQKFKDFKPKLEHNTVFTGVDEWDDVYYLNFSW